MPWWGRGQCAPCDWPFVEDDDRKKGGGGGHLACRGLGGLPPPRTWEEERGEEAGAGKWPPAGWPHTRLEGEWACPRRPPGPRRGLGRA